MTRRPSRRGPCKQLIRERDGKLHDLTADRPITAPELREYLASGGYFEAKRSDGAECTAQVLLEALQEAIARDVFPNVLEAVPGTAPLDALGRLFSRAGPLAGPWGGMLGDPAQRPRSDRGGNRADRRRAASRPRPARRDLDDQATAAPDPDFA